MTSSPVFVIFGAKGFIGSNILKAVVQRVPDYRTYAFDHARVDITNQKQVQEVLTYINPTIVINAAGRKNIEWCEKNKSEAFAVNSRGPEVLAYECAKLGTKLVHLSSPMIFDGTQKLYTKKIYTERSVYNPLNIFGKAKLDAEIAITKICPNHIILRPGFVFGPNGKNPVVDWLSECREFIDITHDYICSPMYLPDLITAMILLTEVDTRGIFHVASRGAYLKVSEFAKEVLYLADSSVNVRSVPLSTVKIPKNLAISAAKIHKSLPFLMLPDWKEGVKHCISSLKRDKPE